MREDNIVADKQDKRAPWQRNIYEVIFGVDTPAGRAFDVVLLWAIGLSVLVVILESVDSIADTYGFYFRIAEWSFTILFTLEYFLRILTVQSKSRYIFSFYGLVDLLSIIPTYLSLFIVGVQSLIVIRALRLLRIFRVLKLGRYFKEGTVLLYALRASREKIVVFVGAVITIVVIMGTTMYLIEGAEHGFGSIPAGMYWAIVTMTTVGYGDIAPQTDLGRFFASILMIMGYGIIAVPTGIVSVELANATKGATGARVCGGCRREGHDMDAGYCRFCGSKL